MGASSSTLAQGEDPLTHEFWRMLDRLNLHDEVEVAGSRRLQCGDEIAVRHAGWQRDSDEQIEGVIVSFFSSFLRRGFADLAVGSRPCSASQSPPGFSHLSLHQDLSLERLSKVLNGCFFGSKSHITPRRLPHLHPLAEHLASAGCVLVGTMSTTSP